MDFKLPDIGEGLTQGEIVKWLVKDGDAIKEDQPMVEVMTDKATVEITAPLTGTVGQILAAEGATVPVGAVIVVLNEGGQAGGGKEPVAAAAPAAAAQAGAGSAPPPAAPPAQSAPAAKAAPAPTPSGSNGSGKVLATPATRRVARELGVDLRQVPGTGPHGRVTTNDVRSLAEKGGAAPAAAPAQAAPAAAPSRPAAQPLPAGSNEERIPIRGIRKRIVEHMVHSKYTAPHYTLVDEVDVTELVKLRADAKALAEAKGVKLSYLPFIVKAVVAGLKEFPYLNASIDDAKSEIVLKRDYHMGFAVDTEQGLVVVVVRDVDRKSILQIAGEIAGLAEKARGGKLASADINGSTFTITNMGPIGGLLATPIINHPEVAIMGVHKIQKRPVVRDDQIVIREMMNLSISLDHRLVDGAMGGRFLSRVIALLEQPQLLLLEA